MMRAMVTGSTGFMGQHLVRALRARGDFVVGMERDRAPGVSTVANAAVWADLSLHHAVPVVERILAEYEIDTVFHLAAQAQVSVAKADPIGTFDANVRGTLSVLEASRRQGVRRVLIASSDKAMGDGPVPYREDQPVLASGVYATSKAMADLAAQSYAREYALPVAIVRCANLYGPGHANFSAIIPDAIRSALTGNPLVLRSDGHSRRDFLYVGDAVDGYLALADSILLGAWNFGTGAPLRVLDVVQAVERAVGAKIEVQRAAAESGRSPERQAMEIRDQWLDVTKARELLGWVPKHTIDQGLAETVPWYREHLDGVRGSADTRG